MSLRIVQSWILLLLYLALLTEAWVSPPSQCRSSLSQLGLTDFDSFVETNMPNTKTLAPHTFAGMVAQALERKFKGQDISRVLTSWMLLDQDYEHKQWFQSSSSSQTNENNEKQRYLQYCHSYVPGLSVKPFWDTTKMDWCGKLQKHFQAIRNEFISVALAENGSIEQRGNNVWAGALTKNAAEYGDSWRTLVLMDRGRWDSVNCNLFPVAAQAVQDCGVDAVEVFFARMQPQTRIEPHSDFTNFVLTSHLPLIVPYAGTNQCRLTVGDTTREWIDGELMLFDTSLIHDAINDSDRARYILMIRLWHPDLTAVEKQALQFTYDCLELPGLTSEDPEERFRAEMEAQAMRLFPKLEKLSAATKGFGARPERALRRKVRK
ncbi:hypothetical protein MPSEU_000779500 [Mayamaea pseudoterrestris]|nr:hypothetical protein MPSEU_000779500 [Mayamaea pseudoterrestris]